MTNKNLKIDLIENFQSLTRAGFFNFIDFRIQTIPDLSLP